MKVVLLFLFIFSAQWASAESSPHAIPFPYYVVNENSENELMAIDSGAPALELRLQMIRRAQKTVEVEYFCYNTDLASKIFTHELIAAAKRGVKVRVLIDKASNVFVFHKYYARELAAFGIEVRYFNNASLLNITKAIYRNHRKLVLVDGEEALTGGRNLGDEYFDMAKTLNYSDRDIYVKGPIVKAMLKSFENFYEHQMSERVKLPKSETNKKALEAKRFLSFSNDELSVKARMEILGQQELKNLKLHVCPITTFASDAPGGGFKGLFSQSYVDKYRFLRKILIEKISTVDKSLLISTPYFLTNDDSRKLIKGSLAKNVGVNIYTNSLTASDATYMSAHMYFTLKSWSKKGIQFYLHNGTWPGENELLNDEVKNAKWSDHSKTHIYESADSSEVMIGTFNMHNRSSYYDAEMAIFCKGNDEFTAEVKSSVMKRIMKGIFIDKDHKAFDSTGKPISKYGPSEKDVQQMKLMTIPAWILKFLL